jgi:serine/threonine protein kinase
VNNSNLAMSEPSASPRRGSLEIGSSFGEYTILRRIGRGGQGSVFEVRDSLGLTWALKISEVMTLQDANAEMRFAREARCVAESLSQLPRHTGVFVGEHYGIWEGRFYVKMKLLKGESLAQRLRRQGQLSIRDAVHIAERIAFAIGHAHELGVLHRDLKPENVFLTEEGQVAVLDWGCLQLLEVAQMRTTQRGVICTPGYAPIEQYLASSALNLTPAVDLYALGVMLYEALTGYHPFLNWSRSALDKPERQQQRELARQAFQAGRSVVNPLGATMPATHSSVDAAVDGPEFTGAELSGAVLTVRVNDEQFGPRTEQHTVSQEILSQLHQAISATEVTPFEPFSQAKPFTGSWQATHATYATQALTGGAARVSSRESVAVDSWALGSAAALAVDDPPQMPSLDNSAADGSGSVGVAPVSSREKAVSPQAKAGPQRDVPRRFSLVEVLTFQERVRPKPIEGIPAELSALVQSLLAKRPTERPQNALEVAAQLRALGSQLQKAGVEFALSTPQANSRYLSRALLWIRLKQNGQRLAWAAAGVVVAGLTGVGAYYGMSASKAATSAESRTAAIALEADEADRHVGATGTSAVNTAPAADGVVEPGANISAADVVGGGTAGSVPGVPSAAVPNAAVPNAAVPRIIDVTGANPVVVGSLNEEGSVPDRQVRPKRKLRPSTDKSAVAANASSPVANSQSAAVRSQSEPTMSSGPPCIVPPCQAADGNTDATNSAARRVRANPNAVVRKRSTLWVE